MLNRRFALPVLIASASLAFAQDSVVPSSDAGNGGAAPSGSLIVPLGGDQFTQPEEKPNPFGTTTGAKPFAPEAPSFSLPGGYGFANMNVVGGEGMFARPPLTFSLTLQQGYDDNIYSSSGKPTIIPAHTEVVTSPGGAFTYDLHVKKQSISSNFPVMGSLVSQGSVGASWLISGSRLITSLQASGGASYYYDRKGAPLDPHGSVSLLSAYKATPRLQLSAQVNGQYLSQPNYALVNASTRQNSGDYIVYSSKFDATYQWTARLGTTTTLSLNGTTYLDKLSQDDNFTEAIFGQSVNFRLSPRTTAVVEGRTGQTTYKGPGRDSQTQFLLLGFDQALSRRFTATVRVGEEYRQYQAANAPAAASPYLESTLVYGYGKASSINWTNRFGFEENSMNSTQRTQNLRSGVTVNQVFTAKTSANFSLSYNHAMYSSISGLQNTGNDGQDSVTAELGLQYVATRTLTFFGELNRTQVLTKQEWTSFSRDSIYLGVSYHF